MNLSVSLNDLSVDWSNTGRSLGMNRPRSFKCVTFFSRSSEGSSGEEEEGEEKKKGVEGLIEIENPNRAAPKAKKTTEALDTEKAPELSRREREEIQKQKARAHYEKMHAAGRTDQVSPFGVFERYQLGYIRKITIEIEISSNTDISISIIRLARILPG